MDSLEKEILRLQLQQKDTEHKLDKQWGKMRHHFGSMVLNSFRRKKEESAENPGLLEGLLQHEKVKETLHNISEKISGKLADLISHLFDKFFRK